MSLDAFNLRITQSTITASLSIGPQDILWRGQESEGSWDIVLPRSDPALATLGGMFAVFLAATPSGAGAEFQPLAPTSTLSSRLIVQSGIVSEEGPFVQPFQLV